MDILPTCCGEDGAEPEGSKFQHSPMFTESKMSFLCRVSVLSLRDRAQNSDIRVKPLLFRAEMSSLPLDVFWASSSLRGAPPGRPRSHKTDYISLDTQ